MTGKFLRGALVALATVGMIIPQHAMAGAPAKAASTNISLNDAGQLVGQTVDGTGVALNGATVELRKNGVVASSAKTNDKGQFTIDAVVPGSYQLSVGDRVAEVRLWNAKTAPPNALPQALLLAGEPAVRGQYSEVGCPPGDCNTGGGYFGGLDFITLATVATATTAAVVSIITLSKVNDLEDCCDSLSASP